MMGAKPTNTKANAFLAFARGDGASDGMIASEMVPPVTRQRISILRQQWKKATRPTAIESESDNGTESSDATDFTKATADGLHGTQSASLAGTAPQPAMPDNALERQRLVELVSDDEVLAEIVDRILKGDAPRAAALAFMSPKVFARRMENDEQFFSLILRAAHAASSSVAQNLYRLANSNAPTASASAIAWLEKRMPESWGREATKIEVSVEGGIDINHILSDPARIRAVNAFERAMQEAEAAQLPAHQVGEIIDLEPIEVRDPVVPELPRDDLTRVPDKVEIAPRMNRPGQGDASKLGRTREVIVDGIRTLMVDERSPEERDDRPPF